MGDPVEDFSRLEASDANKDLPRSSNAAAAAQPVRDPHPSPDMPDKALNGGVNSPAFLTGLVKWHPAIGSFQYLADCTHPAKMPPDERFNNLAERVRWLFWACVIIDFLYMAAVLVGLGVIAGRVIYVTLWA